MPGHGGPYTDPRVHNANPKWRFGGAPGAPRPLPNATTPKCAAWGGLKHKDGPNRKRPPFPPATWLLASGRIRKAEAVAMRDIFSLLPVPIQRVFAAK